MTAANVRYENLTPEHRALVDQAVARMNQRTTSDRKRTMTYEDSAWAVLDVLPYTTPEDIKRWHELATLIVDIAVHELNSVEVPTVYCVVCHDPIPREDEYGEPLEPHRYSRTRFCSRACRSKADYRKDRIRDRDCTCVRCGTGFSTRGYGKKSVCDGCKRRVNISVPRSA